jgi:tRNA threonylcarbamoyl adenosine modification protein (Sua5/YciO/YrdC/YwlC family)
MRLSVHPTTPEPRKIARAVEVLKKGGVIAYPTDTVYGIGCDLFEKKAIERVYTVKGMRRDQPLAFLCADLSDIARFALVSDEAYRTMRRLVPGPYTFILPATREVPKMVILKQKTVGIRVPDHPVAQALLRALGGPIISTSASRGGEVLTDPEEIEDLFPLDVVLDAGPSGLEASTVLAFRSEGIEVIRQGKGPVP